MSDLVKNKYYKRETLKKYRNAKSGINVSDFCYQYDGSSFSFGLSTSDGLPPGFYSIGVSKTRGIVVIPESVSFENILDVEDSVSNILIKEVVDFWEREELYKKYKTSHKRGILMYGPPGSGKTSTIKLLIKDVIERKGLVIKVPMDFDVFVDALDEIRKRNPSIPIVALMEDFEDLVVKNGSIILNTLDGAKPLNNIVFIATTNHPENLGPRFMNRPKRFDTVIEIGFPNAKLREEYLKYVITGKGEFQLDQCLKDFGVSLEKWVIDTENLSFAHLDELFTNVVLLGSSYEETIKKLKEMSEPHPGYAFNGKRRESGDIPCDDDDDDRIDDDDDEDDDY